MSDECMPMPEPAPEHGWLASKAGVWDVDCTMWMAPGAPPFTCVGVDTAEMVGSFWLRATFSCDMGGTPFIGQSMLGFDPAKGKFFGTWVDGFSAGMSHFEGAKLADGSLEMKGEGMGPMGPQSKFRMHEVHHSADSFTFSMYYELPDGGELKMMQYEYKRRK